MCIRMLVRGDNLRSRWDGMNCFGACEVLGADETVMV